MGDIIKNIIWTSAEVTLVCLALVLLLNLSEQQKQTIVLTENLINEKHNIEQSYGQEEDSVNICTMSSVLSSIKEIEEDIVIEIDNREVKEEDRKKYIEDNDSSQILNYLNTMFNYSPDYIYDAEGNLVKINFISNY